MTTGFNRLLNDIRVLPTDGAKDLSAELLMGNGKLKLLSENDYKNFDPKDLRIFCHFHGRYGLPTIELIQFIKNIIGGRSAIEIGAGCGDLGYHLGIVMTDSKLQDLPHIKASYENMKQPTIKYPDDVRKFDAIDAIKTYRPKVVIASWVTAYSPTEMPYNSNPYGVREDKILEMVDTYILIGNEDTHGDKPIMKKPHATVSNSFIWSRAKNPDNNRIYIWENIKG